MKASELIAKLQTLINTHGDLPVFLQEKYYAERLTRVFYYKEISHYYPNSEDIGPAIILDDYIS